MLLAFLLFILVSAIGAGVFVFLKKYDACSRFEGSFWVWPQMRCYTVTPKDPPFNERCPDGEVAAERG
jgi:hypothetical protein